MSAADILLGAAHRLMPKVRRDWAEAMRSEADHIPEDERVSFALGCCWTAIKLRLDPMKTGDFRVSRWVMLVEMLCFLPITIGWWDAVVGDSGVVHLNADIASKYFLASTQGTYVLGMMIAAAAVGLAGPMGLICAARYFLTGRGISSARFGITMIAGVALWGVAAIGARIAFGDGAYAASGSSLLLLVIQPIAVLAHLMYLARPHADPPARSLAVA